MLPENRQVLMFGTSSTSQICVRFSSNSACPLVYSRSSCILSCVWSSLEPALDGEGDSQVVKTDFHPVCTRAAIFKGLILRGIFFSGCKNKVCTSVRFWREHIFREIKNRYLVGWVALNVNWFLQAADVHQPAFLSIQGVSTRIMCCCGCKHAHSCSKDRHTLHLL